MPGRLSFSRRHLSAEADQHHWPEGIELYPTLEVAVGNAHRRLSRPQRGPCSITPRRLPVRDRRKLCHQGNLPARSRISGRRAGWRGCDGQQPLGAGLGSDRRSRPSWFDPGHSPHRQQGCGNVWQRRLSGDGRSLHGRHVWPRRLPAAGWRSTLVARLCGWRYRSPVRHDLHRYPDWPAWASAYSASAPAGLQKHTIRNTTHMHIPDPVEKVNINVRQIPARAIPRRPVTSRFANRICTLGFPPACHCICGIAKTWGRATPGWLPAAAKLTGREVQWVGNGG